jgi:hypothetical protein
MQPCPATLLQSTLPHCTLGTLADMRFGGQQLGAAYVVGYVRAEI